jgi:hypothetical protein
MESENCADGDYCAVCFDAFSEKSPQRPLIDKQITLICGEGTEGATTNKNRHCFHKSCLKRWVIKSVGSIENEPTCPKCKQPFSIHPRDLEEYNLESDDELEFFQELLSEECEQIMYIQDQLTEWYDAKQIALKKYIQSYEKNIIQIFNLKLKELNDSSAELLEIQEEHDTIEKEFEEETDIYDANRTKDPDIVGIYDYSFTKSLLSFYMYNLISIEQATILSIDYTFISRAIYLKQLSGSSDVEYRDHATFEKVIKNIETQIQQILRLLSTTRHHASDLLLERILLKKKYGWKFNIEANTYLIISLAKLHADNAIDLGKITYGQPRGYNFMVSLWPFIQSYRDIKDIELTSLFAEELEKQGENIPETLNQTLIKGLTERVQERNPELQLVVSQGGKRTNRRTTRRVKKRVKKQFTRRVKRQFKKRFNRRTL